MYKLINLVFILIFVVLKCECYQMTRCQLVKELRKYGFPEDDMRDWVCLVENESSRKTDIIGQVNSNGSRDYGLFQINDKYWCSSAGKPGNDCKVTCDDLILDNISKAVKCAKKIYRKQGFIAWHGWERNCQGQLPDISECDKKQ